MLLVPHNPLLTFHYSWAFRTDFLASLAVIIAISFYYEYLRNRAEKRVSDQEIFYRTLIMHGKSVFSVTDERGMFTFVSPSVSTVFGYSGEEFLQSHFAEMIHPDDREEAQNTFQTLLGYPNQSAAIELRLRHKNGQWRDCDVFAINMLDNPALGGIAITSNDITQIKAAQRELRLLNENLELRVKERTEQLRKRDEQLFHTEKMRAVGQLAGGIAHDFNNQLTGILGCAQWIRSKASQESELHDHASIIISAAHNASRLTSQLLTFAHRRTSTSAPVDIDEIVRSVTRLLGHSLKKNITLRHRPGSGVRAIMGDANQIENAVMNLALNARDAMPEGGVMTFETSHYTHTDAGRHAASLTRPLPPGAYVRLRISDTGAGIPADVREHIFEPFFTTKAQDKGTGMGLAGVYAAVEAHNGAIGLETAEGAGTTFTLLFPAAAFFSEQKSFSGIDRKAEKNAAPSRVLLIDDDPSVRRMTHMVLRGAGYDVASRGHGDEAIALFKSDPAAFDAVLLDMVMPGMTGAQVFERLRAIDPDVAVILFSGYAKDSDAQKLIGAGAAGFIQKPFVIAELAEAIEKAIDSRRRG
jgi:PAS domain S-box-containing protein